MILGFVLPDHLIRGGIDFHDGAAVGAGAMRAVVEDGFLDKDRQVGQTGKTVRPSLYIACGISGAVQHCAGMDKSDLIISINRDPQAEIFNISNMGFVGDCATVLPLLVESIKAAKAE